MPNPDLLVFFRSLQATQFRDLTGAQITARVPVAERVINELVALTLPTTVPIREAHVHPEPGDRFTVRLAPRSAFLPSLTIKLTIERQPDLPGSPMLVLRMSKMGGLFGLATAAFPIASMLPPGVRLDGELIYVDLRTLAAQHGATDLLHFLKRLTVSTLEGQVVLDVDAAV